LDDRKLEGHLFIFKSQCGLSTILLGEKQSERLAATHRQHHIGHLDFFFALFLQKGACFQFLKHILPIGPSIAYPAYHCGPIYENGLI
jgi:hypothetical protein